MGGGKGGFREEQIRLNLANEFPGVSFRKREDCFSSFLFTFLFIFSLLFTSLHLPQTPTDLGGVVGFKKFGFPHGACPEESDSRDSGTGKEWLSSLALANAKARVSGEPRQVP